MLYFDGRGCWVSTKRLEEGTSVWRKPWEDFPQSLTRKTINYTLTLWDKLILYAEHSKLEIDNNLAEMPFGPAPWIKRTGGSSEEPTAAKRVGSCAALDIKPEEYLRLETQGLFFVEDIVVFEEVLHGFGSSEIVEVAFK